VGVAVASVVGGTDVGVAVAGGVSGAWVHPATTRSRVTTDRTRIRENFFISCSGTSPDIIITKKEFGGCCSFSVGKLCTRITSLPAHINGKKIMLGAVQNTTI